MCKCCLFIVFLNVSLDTQSKLESCAYTMVDLNTAKLYKHSLFVLLVTIELDC